LFEGKQAPMDLVVRARVATTIENLVALRDLLIHLFPIDKPASEIPTGGGATGKLGVSLSKAPKDIRSRQRMPVGPGWPLCTGAAPQSDQSLGLGPGFATLTVGALRLLPAGPGARKYPLRLRFSARSSHSR
jgi:hypothetical protein